MPLHPITPTLILSLAEIPNPEADNEETNPNPAAVVAELFKNILRVVISRFFYFLLFINGSNIYSSGPHLNFL